MAQRQIVISLGRDTSRTGVNVLTGDPGELTLSDPVDINDVAITGVTFSYSAIVPSGEFSDFQAAHHDNAAAAISWLDTRAAETKTGPDDASNSTLTITATGLGSTASFQIVTQNGFSAERLGTLAVNSETTGEINLNFNSTTPADPNYVGSPVTFTDVAANGSGEHVISISSTNFAKWNAMLVTFDDAHLTSTNTPPTAVDDTATTDEDTSVNIDVLANDSDADSDTLSVTAANATNGTVVIETDNTLTYTPDSGFTGSDTISYTVSDGTDTTNATVTITVNAASSGGSSLTAPIGSPSAQSQLIDEITVAGPLFNGIAAANPGLDLVGLGAFAEVITGTPTYDLATGSWETLASNTEWDVYVYNGTWSSASRVSASAGQASTDVGGGSVVTPMSVVSAGSTMQRGANYQVTIQDPPITPTTSNTSLVSGNDSLACTLVEDLGSAQYRLTFAVGDLSKQVNATGYNWSVLIEAP